jgi:hypothetical protein
VLLHLPEERISLSGQTSTLRGEPSESAGVCIEHWLGVLQLNLSLLPAADVGPEIQLALRCGTLRRCAGFLLRAELQPQLMQQNHFLLHGTPHELIALVVEGLAVQSPGSGLQGQHKH